MDSQTTGLMDNHLDGQIVGLIPLFQNGWPVIHSSNRCFLFWKTADKQGAAAIIVRNSYDFAEPTTSLSFSIFCRTIDKMKSFMLLSSCAALIRMDFLIS